MRLIERLKKFLEENPELKELLLQILIELLLDELKKESEEGPPIG